jgi:hypothetical protein
MYYYIVEVCVMALLLVSSMIYSCLLLLFARMSGSILMLTRVYDSSVCGLLVPPLTTSSYVTVHYGSCITDPHLLPGYENTTGP